MDSRTQMPLATVRLQLTPASRAVTTGADGQFTFENIAAGAYVLSAQKQGYMNLRRENLTLPGNSGIPISIKAGETLKLSLGLARAPTATGRILDDRGRPVLGIRVIPVRLVYDEQGMVVPKSFESATTNDLGEYRLSNLDAGDYLLKIEPPSSAGFRPNASLYYPVYYPGVSETRGATPVTLKGGEETRLTDVVLRSARGAKLHFEALLNPGVTATRDFTLYARREGTLNQVDAINASATSRTTDIGPLGPGIYGIHIETIAGNDRLVGTARFEVEEQDLSVSVNLDQAIIPKGKVTVALSSGVAQPLSGVRVGLNDPVVPRTLPFLLTSEADGSLRTVPTGLAPGTYTTRVAGFPSELYVASIQGRGMDLLRNSVTLRFKDELQLDITLGTAGVAQGTVTDVMGSPVVDAVIALVPERREDSHLYKSVRSNERGSFDVYAAPGAYRLFAWSEIEGAAYRDPVFMQKYEAQGRALTIESGRRVSIDLKVLD